MLALVLISIAAGVQLWKSKQRVPRRHAYVQTEAGHSLIDPIELSVKEHEALLQSETDWTIVDAI